MIVWSYKNVSQIFLFPLYNKNLTFWYDNIWFMIYIYIFFLLLCITVRGAVVEHE